MLKSRFSVLGTLLLTALAAASVSASVSANADPGGARPGPAPAPTFTPVPTPTPTHTLNPVMPPCATTCSGDNGALSTMRERRNGVGSCEPVLTVSCFPGRCQANDGQCTNHCVTSSDCTGGAVCDSDGFCNAAPARCSDPWTVRAPDGTISYCDGYRCRAGQCSATCLGDSDCRGGPTFKCRSSRCIDTAN
jgi:hypothetical protein